MTRIYAAERNNVTN